MELHEPGLGTLHLLARHLAHLPVVGRLGEHLLGLHEDLGCHGTQYVRHTGAGRRTAYVQYWAPRGQLPCTSGTYSTQEAGTRSPYVQYEGPGAYM